MHVPMPPDECPCTSLVLALTVWSMECLFNTVNAQATTNEGYGKSNPTVPLPCPAEQLHGRFLSGSLWSPLTSERRRCTRHMASTFDPDLGAEA